MDQVTNEPDEAPELEAPGPDTEPEPEPEPDGAPRPETDDGAPETVPEPAQPARSGRSTLVEVARTLLLTLVFFLVIQNFVAQPFKVDGQSMEMTFVEGDYVLVDRLTPRWSAYTRGQVVVLEAPDDWSERGEPFIKRVIGVAGDTVEVREDGTVAVNGAVLDEPYLFRDEAGTIEPTFADEEAPWVVGDGELFVMGDHRQASMDSRAFGPIPLDSVIGRGVMTYWPLSSLGVVESATHDNVPAP